MASPHRVPLSYPNPSFSQMACLEDQGSQSGGLTKPAAELIVPPVSGVRQAVLMASYEKPLPCRAYRAQLTRRSLLVGLLFSSLDTSIVSTSLVTISHELNDFANAPWIVLAYLLTYMGQSGCSQR